MDSQFDFGGQVSKEEPVKTTKMNQKNMSLSSSQWVMVLVAFSSLFIDLTRGHDFGTNTQGAVAQSVPCNQQRLEAMADQAHRGIMDMFVPLCNDEDDRQYYHTQCYGMHMPEPCYCVDQVTGEEIENSRGQTANSLRCQERQQTIEISRRPCVLGNMFQADPVGSVSRTTGSLVPYGETVTVQCRPGWAFGDGKTTSGQTTCGDNSQWLPALIGCARRIIETTTVPTTQAPLRNAGSWWQLFWRCIFPPYECNNVWNR